MKGDLLYCLHCNKLSRDVWVMYDTRHGGRSVHRPQSKERFQPRCPYCLSIFLVNASKIIEDGDRIVRSPNGIDGYSPNNWKDLALYKILKRFPIFKAENIK